MLRAIDLRGPTASSKDRLSRARSRGGVLAAVVALSIAATAAAQSAEKLPRVGMLSPGENDQTPIFAAFREGLRGLGYVDGHTIVLEYRFARGDYGALPALAAELTSFPVYPEPEYADDGGLMAYGANVPDNFRRAASYVDRILKGANPGDLPIQQPLKLDFIVNLKTTGAIGLAFSPNFLARADEAIE
jgi:ABC-type uncharacterized transport system substrate-binding protein